MAGTTGKFKMRGYFGVGVDGISKPMNLGNLLRIAHAFDASFFFTVNAHVKLSDAESDTSRAEGVMPVYSFAKAEDFSLPVGCRLVGVEIADDALELPRFRHPQRAAYVFGGERSSLSEAMLKRCEFVVKIPTRFSINVGMAGAIVLYDRLISLGGYPGRPLAPGREPVDIPPPHKWGAPVMRKRG
jgi:tRNA G18 (ribose-2'-O)-methylase SpoU